MNKVFLVALLLLSAMFQVAAQTVNYEVYALKYSGAFNDKPFPLKLLVLDAPEKETAYAVFVA